jgi:hypothetical protein
VNGSKMTEVQQATTENKKPLVFLLRVLKFMKNDKGVCGWRRAKKVITGHFEACVG